MSRYNWQAPDGPWEAQVLIVDQDNDNFTGANGRVTLVNQDGTKWTPSGGDVTSDDITDATAVGKSVLTADDAAAARAAIGAGTSSLTLGTTASTALAGNYKPAWGDVTGKPSFGTAAQADTGDFATSAQGAKADSAVQPADLSPYAKTADVATAAQGDKADTAVQPADLSPYAKTSDLALANASVAANVATGSTVDDVIAALIAAGLMASA